MVERCEKKRAFPLIQVRHPFLWIGVLLAVYAAACLISVASSGGRLTVYTDIPFGYEGKPELSLEGKGISVDGMDVMPDRKLKLTVRALEPGETDVKMRWRGQDEAEGFLTFRSGRMRTVMERSSMNFSGCAGLVISTAVALALLEAIVIAHFAWRLRNDFYSYRTALTGGMGIYGAVIALLFLYVCQDWWRSDAHGTVYHILTFFSSAGSLFMYLSVPALFLICLGLFVSNLSLIRHEGFHPANLLAAAGALAVIGGFFLAVAVDNAFTSGSFEQYRLHACVTTAVTACFVFMEAMLLGTMLCGLIAAKREPEHDRDAIIIHGCRIARDGTPLPLLRGRIDRALAFAEKQKKAAGKELVFIPSGGQGADECISEGDCIAGYLRSKGVKENQLLIENRSVSTLENLRFSKELIEQRFSNARVAFSTTNYHVFRCGILARQVGLEAQGMGAKTKWYFWPNAFIREFVAMIAAEKKALLVICLEMAAFFTALTYFSVG